VLDGLRHSFRFLMVARALARHDALFWVRDIGPAPRSLKLAIAVSSRLVLRKRGLPEDEGERLAAALRSLGPAYIKLGQMLATRPDLTGTDVAEGLRALQDKLPPFPADQARRLIAEELERPVDEMFTHFEEEAVAAASIAQVHKAETAEGKTVAVKVLRPGIEAKFRRDLQAFKWAARFAERAIPAARRLRPVAVVDTVAQSVAQELDLRLEAASASELAEGMAGEAGYRVPEVDWERTTKRILTLEWIDGIPLWDNDALDAAGYDRSRLAAVVVRAFLLQSMRDGFFHADLHQGNLFVDAQGSVVALDFGIMGRLDVLSRRYLAEILYGFQQRDYLRVARWHFSAGYVGPEHSVEQFALAMRAIAEPIFGRPARDISAGRLLGQLFATTEAFGMETQPQLLLLQRSMVMVEGLALHLDSEANMWTLSRPVIAEWMREQLAPEAAAADAINEFVTSFGDWPLLVRRARSVLEGLEAGTLPARRRDTRMPTAQASSGRGGPLLPAVLGALAGAALASAAILL